MNEIVLFVTTLVVVVSIYWFLCGLAAFELYKIMLKKEEKIVKSQADKSDMPQQLTEIESRRKNSREIIFFGKIALAIIGFLYILEFITEKFFNQDK